MPSEQVYAALRACGTFYMAPGLLRVCAEKAMTSLRLSCPALPYYHTRHGRSAGLGVAKRRAPPCSSWVGGPRGKSQSISAVCGRGYCGGGRCEVAFRVGLKPGELDVIAAHFLPVHVAHRTRVDYKAMHSFERPLQLDRQHFSPWRKRVDTEEFARSCPHDGAQARYGSKTSLVAHLE